MSTEIKKCECGKNMVLLKSCVVVFTYPAIIPRQWFCGGCGRKEDGPMFREKTIEEINMNTWREVNPCQINKTQKEFQRNILKGITAKKPFHVSECQCDRCEEWRKQIISSTQRERSNEQNQPTE